MRRSRSASCSPNARRLARCSLALLGAASLLWPVSAAAQARAEEDAASQSLDSDRDLAAWDIALTTDLLAPLSDGYGVRLEVAPARWLSLAASPTWLSAAGASGVALVVSAHAWPLAQGLDGPFVGPHLTVARVEGSGAARVMLGVGGEAGWQVVWEGLAVALSGTADWAARADGGPSGLGLGVRIGLGWAWR